MEFTILETIHFRKLSLPCRSASRLQAPPAPPAVSKQQQAVPAGGPGVGRGRAGAVPPQPRVPGPGRAAGGAPPAAGPPSAVGRRPARPPAGERASPGPPAPPHAVLPPAQPPQPRGLGVQLQPGAQPLARELPQHAPRLLRRRHRGHEARVGPPLPHPARQHRYARRWLMWR